MAIVESPGLVLIITPVLHVMLGCVNQYHAILLKDNIKSMKRMISYSLKQCSELADASIRRPIVYLVRACTNYKSVCSFSASYPSFSSTFCPFLPLTQLTPMLPGRSSATSIIASKSALPQGRQSFLERAKSLRSSSLSRGRQRSGRDFGHRCGSW